MDGNEPIKLSDYRGKCVLIVFWNSPTTLGRPEAVALKAVSSRVGNGDRLVVLGINCDFQGEEAKAQRRRIWMELASGEASSTIAMGNSAEVRRL